MDRDDPAYRDQSDYTPSLLRLYDPIVLGVVASAVWRRPRSRLVEGYRQHIRDRHLDVGPGAGYFIEHSGLPDGSRVTILDPNPNVLDHAARRLQRLAITAMEADVLKALPVVGLACLDRCRARRLRSPMACCSAPRSSARPGHRPGCRAAGSPPSTGGAHSTTSKTPRTAFAGSSPGRSIRSSSRSSARSRSSLQRLHGETGAPSTLPMACTGGSTAHCRRDR